MDDRPRSGRTSVNGLEHPRSGPSLGGLESERQSRFSASSSVGTVPGSKAVEHSVAFRREEEEYPAWWTRKRVLNEFYTLCDDVYWNSFICIMALAGIVWVAIGLNYTVLKALDIVYNVTYAVHVFGLTYNTLTNLETGDLTFTKSLAFLVDMVTFSHYVSYDEDFKLFCYYLRMYRPFSFLWALNDSNLQASVLGTTLKFCYIFLVMRVSWALVWIEIDELEQSYVTSEPLTRRALSDIEKELQFTTVTLDERMSIKFLTSLYLVNKMFIPIGPSVPLSKDVERLVCLAIMLSGCLVVTAFAVASLTLVISLYMRPEETFRARYRLIIKEMNVSHIPTSQRDKVETFYKMYWHKQRAVYATQLLPTFPPTLPATIYMDIYFEATQKSRVLRDLSYQFLSELSKRMETIHYIPGDTIIKRMSNKSSSIYITYGDIELVTAEDDSTAILRLTRGTILTPCAVCAPAGLGRAHLQVRAATFCTAHVLKATDLWKVVNKHGMNEKETDLILFAYNEHMDRVKIHYESKALEEVKHKSSIMHFKRCLMALKEAKDANGNLLLAQTDVFLEIAGCYIMRNRADATLTDESDAICLRPTFPYIFQPTSSLQVAWNLLVSCLILFVTFVHPYYLVFSKVVPIEFRFFDYVVTAVFVLDLFIYLSTGANVEEGVPITFMQTSSKQMRSYWFVLDVLGTAPIFEFIGAGHFAGINKILRLPKVFRVLKELEEACVYRSHVLRFFSYMLLLLVACYLIAALQQGFMCFQFDYCVVTNLTHSPFWENKPLDDETIEYRLSFAMYWAISMMMFTSHKETWGTDNWNNVLYTLIVLEVCIVLRIFIEAAYSATILVTTALREDYDACIVTVNSFLIRNRVDPILRQRFISYLQLCWYSDKAYSMTNKRSIFYDLPSHVYQDIVAKQRSKYILAIPFMKYVSQEVLKNISTNARLFYTSPKEILLNTGDISNEIYVIKKGICEILSPETKGVVGLLNVKCNFGVLVCLLRIPAYYTIRAVTNVQLFSISRKHLIQAIEAPHLKDAIEFVKTQPEFQRLLVRRQSFATYTPPDPIPNMEKFPLPRKHEHDSDFLMPFYRLGFLSVLRYIFPRFTIRPDGQYLIHYEWFRALCAFTSAMVFPSYSYMVLQWPWLYTITLLLDLSAYFDIFQRMLVGYYNADGILVYHPSSTAAHYLKGAFFVDLFGCIALENLDAPQRESANKHSITQMSQFLMMNRLIQLYRLPSAMIVLRMFIERRDILTVFKAIPLFMVMLNVLTSFMVLHSVTIYQKEDNEKWLIEPFNDNGGSWVELFRHEFRFNLTESPFNLHLGTYFWMVYETSTTGYNNLKPSNVNLIRLLFLGMLIGAMIMTYFSVRIISIRANVNKALAEFQEHMKDMVAFMKRENLQSELQKLVLDYYEYTWDKMGGVNYRKMFKLCDQITLRTDAILHIYGPTFAKCPILANSDISLLRIVGRAVYSSYLLRGMNVVEANDVIAEMYFVDYGEVDARETTEELCTVVKLFRGSVFGNLDSYPTVRCPISFVAASRVHLLKINSATFHHIINDFPAVLLLMKKFRPGMKNYIPGDVADVTDKSRQQQSVSHAPIIANSHKGLIKHLYLNTKYLQIYLIIISLLCIYMDFYNAGFQDNSMPFVIILYVLDLCFIVKVLLYVIQPLIVRSDAIKKILEPVRKAYIKEEFKYDLLSCIPFELLCFLVEKYKWSVFACLRLNRMFRIKTVYHCLQRHKERITINLTLSTVFSAFIWFTLFVHITSCLWYFIGTVEEWRKPKSSWIYKDNSTSWCGSVYVCSIYFMLTTFTQNGVGDIMPKNQSEVIFVCVLQIISTMIYMIYVGEFSNIIQYQSFRACSFYSKYLELQEFLKNNRVSKNLVNIVYKYSLHLWRETRGMQAPYFLHTAPQALKLQVMSACYLHHLTRHHVFENCEPAFLRQLVGCLQLYTYNEDMYVVKSSEITASMYFIHMGKIEEIPDASYIMPRIYPAGSYFGLMQGMIHDIPFKHSYRTMIKSQVLTLRLDDWLYLIKHYPASRDAISKYMEFDDRSTEGGGGGGSHGWPRPPKPPRPTLVTELVDKGSPPTPPKEGDSVTKELSLTFSETQKSSEELKPIMLQPQDSPLSSVEKIQEHMSSVKLASARKTTQLSYISQDSATSLKPRGPRLLDELATSTHLLTKVTDTAKIDSAKRDDVSNMSNDELRSKDTLLLQEEEVATTTLLKEIDKKHEQRKKTIFKSIRQEEKTNLLATASTSNIADDENMLTVDIAQPETRQNSEDESVTSLKLLFALKRDYSKPYDETNWREADEKEAKEIIGEMSDVAISGPSKRVSISLIKQAKNEETIQQKTRHVTRVRYKDDDEEEIPRARSVDYTPYTEQRQSPELLLQERNLRMLDSETTEARSSDNTDEIDDLISTTGSNTSRMSRAGSVHSVTKRKKKKK